MALAATSLLPQPTVHAGAPFSTVASRRAHVALGARVLQCCCRVSGRARAFVVSATSRAAAAAVQQAGRTRYARARSYYTCTCLPCVAGWCCSSTLESAPKCGRSFSLAVLQSVLTGAAWARPRACVGLDSTSTTEVNAVCTWIVAVLGAQHLQPFGDVTRYLNIPSYFLSPFPIF